MTLSHSGAPFLQALSSAWPSIQAVHTFIIRSFVPQPASYWYLAFWVAGPCLWAFGPHKWPWSEHLYPFVTGGFKGPQDYFHHHTSENLSSLWCGKTEETSAGVGITMWTKVAASMEYHIDWRYFWILFLRRTKWYLLSIYRKPNSLLWMYLSPLHCFHFMNEDHCDLWNLTCRFKVWKHLLRKVTLAKCYALSCQLSTILQFLSWTFSTRGRKLNRKSEYLLAHQIFLCTHVLYCAKSAFTHIIHLGTYLFKIIDYSFPYIHCLLNIVHT